MFHVEHLGFLRLVAIGLFHVDHKKRDIRWGDTRDARGLAKSMGLNICELLAGLIAEAGDGLVVHPGRDLFGFHGTEFLHFVFLTVDVALILDDDFYLLLNFWVQTQIGLR